MHIQVDHQRHRCIRPQHNPFIAVVVRNYDPAWDQNSQKSHSQSNICETDLCPCQTNWRASEGDLVPVHEKRSKYCGDEHGDQAERRYGDFCDDAVDETENEGWWEGEDCGLAEEEGGVRSQDDLRRHFEDNCGIFSIVILGRKNNAIGKL